MPDQAGDFLGIWRSLLQQWETQANASLTEAASNEAFSREVNRLMSTNLKMQGAFNEALEKALAALNMPSRGEVARLAEQLSSIERKLDILLMKQGLDGAAPGAAVRPKPARTRRPPNPDGRP